MQLTNFSNVKEAVEAYISYCKQYKCTPLKVELLRTLLKAKETELFQEAVNGTESVYGIPSTNLSIIAALAEEGMEKPLRNFLLVSSSTIFHVYFTTVILLTLVYLDLF